MANFVQPRLYKNHGDHIGYWEGWTEGPWVITQHASRIVGQKTQTRYAAIGKNIGKANETSPEQQAILELQAKARLKQDKGYTKDYEAARLPATNTLGLKRPMLATPIEKVKPEKIDWSSAYVQPKLDGHRALFKDGILYSRQGKPLELPHIMKAIAESGLDHLHLDGELYVHGRPLQEVSRLIKKYTADSLEVKYHIYDCVMDDIFLGRSLAIHEGLQDETYQDSHHIELVDTILVTSIDEVMAFHENFRQQGYEGTMLRYGDEHYRDGKRSQALLKIKEFHDAEFEVIGWEEGKPRHSDGKVYAVPVWVCKVQGNGETFNVTAQGNMHEKNTQWHERTDHMGRMLTVKYHYMSKDGIPQLPIALRWKEDV